MSVSQTPQTMPPPPPEPLESQAAPPKRRTALVAVTIGLVVALVAGITAFAITRGERAEAAPLALSFTEGQEQTYEIHQTMDAEISSYQDDNYDPYKDGPPIVRSQEAPETDGEAVIPRV